MRNRLKPGVRTLKISKSKGWALSKGANPLLEACAQLLIIYTVYANLVQEKKGGCPKKEFPNGTEVPKLESEIK